MTTPKGLSIWSDDLIFWLNSKNYDVLNRLIDSGRALERVYSRHAGEYWETVLSESINQGDIPTFRRIIELYGADVLKNAISSPGLTGFDVLAIALDNGTMWSEERVVEVMLEIVLDTLDGDDDMVHKFLRSKDFRHIANVFYESHWNRVEHVASTVWCLQTIHSASLETNTSIADGLEETVGKRMQAESTWEYEPKIKRTKY
jgi:hypothetical protein